MDDGTRGTFLEFRKNNSLPALAVDATAAHWVLMALCDARIGFPTIFPLGREVFFWVFTSCLSLYFYLLRERVFSGFLHLFRVIFSSCERGFF